MIAENKIQQAKVLRKENRPIVSMPPPKDMSELQAEAVADGLIRELKRLESIENRARAVFNARTPRHIVTPDVSVPTKTMNALGAVLKIEKGIVPVVEEPESEELDGN